MGRYAGSDYLQAALDKENEQEQLKLKHDIEDENVVVVEKTPVLSYLLLVLRVLFTIALFLLAAVGAFSLLYPELRELFFKILSETLKSIGG